MPVGTLTVDGWAVTLGRATGHSPRRPFLAVPNVTASVSITVLLYSTPLLCGCNVAIKGLTTLDYGAIAVSPSH